MMRKHLAAIAVTSTAIMSGCGSKQALNSRLDGHYEASSAAAMDAFHSQQTLIPEYHNSRGVIISLPLLTDMNKEAMAKAILDSGVSTLWITVPANFKGTVSSAPELARLRSALGTLISKVVLVPVTDAGQLTVWARDWSPLGAKSADGRLRLLDLNYYADRDADDSTARALAARRILDFDRVSVPVYNEGGNFMNNGRGHCMMTTRVTDANNHKEQSDDMILNASQIQGYYQSMGGCSKVSIFPRIPYEGTGHIDMWAKFLDDDTVIVNEIREEILNLRGYTSTDRSKVRNVQSYLNTRASEIAAMGYKVIRVPMPAPAFSENGDVWRSYTNSLTVNGDAITPRYTTPAFDDVQYLDSALRPAYEKEVQSVYESLGYRFKWVDADDLIAIGGAVHCTTMQIPL